jgi:hypothetical protein
MPKFSIFKTRLIMNMFKKLVVAAVFLCAAAVVNAEIVNAEEGTKVGVRFGYSMQSVAYGMGMLGLRAGVDIDVPVGPVFISPELALLYRNNWSSTTVIGGIGGKAVDWAQPEFAVSIPVMIKFFLGLSSSIAIGAQVDIPINAKECLDNDCNSMDGKESVDPNRPHNSFKRAGYDAGLVLSFGYIITESLALDFRYVYGLTPHHTYKTPINVGEFKSSPLSSYGFGITYFFL